MLDVPAHDAHASRIGEQRQARVPAAVELASLPRRGPDQQVDARPAIHEDRVRDHPVGPRAEHHRLGDTFGGELGERQSFAVASDVAGNGPFDLRQ